jgi:hypothetical protein
MLTLTIFRICMYHNTLCTCVMCHTCHKRQCHVSLVKKCVKGDLWVTDFTKVWGGGSKSDSKAFGRLLGKQPKVKVFPHLEALVRVGRGIRHAWESLRKFVSLELFQRKRAIKKKPTVWKSKQESARQGNEREREIKKERKKKHERRKKEGGKVSTFQTADIAKPIRISLLLY